MARDSDNVSTEAVIWLARLERGLQPQEGTRLREWLQDAPHRDCIVEQAKLYHGPEVIAVLAQLVPVGFGPAPSPSIPKRTHPIIFMVVLAVCLLPAIGPLFAVHRYMPGVISRNPAEHPVPWGEQLYATRGGETRNITLLDGSKVTLNAHSELAVLFGPASRAANLDYGEADFQVAKEPYRPFEVNAGGRHFVAPPSRFDVRVISAKAVELTVLDGGVTVRGLPWRWPSTPSEARLFDPRAFADATIGPMQGAMLEDTFFSRYDVTPAAAHARLRWQPEKVMYISLSQ